MKRRVFFVVATVLVAFAHGRSQTGVPDLSWYGDGSASEFYISSADQLAGLCELSNGFKLGSEPVQFLGKIFYLTEDIDLACYGEDYSFMGGTGWYPIGDSGTSCFHAVFDGNGKTIRNLYMNRSNSDLDYVGLFGFIGTGGAVRNLTVEGVNVKASLSSYARIGIVVGHFSGDEIKDCVVRGNIEGRGCTGGVVGSCSSGVIAGCYFKGMVDGGNSGGNSGGIAGLIQQAGAVADCFTDGEVYAGGSAGGIAGGMEGMGSAGEVAGCISVAKVGSRGASYSQTAGGIAAGGSNGVVRNCIALNPSVMGGDCGRAVAHYSSCRNLLAFEGMECNTREWEKTHLGKDGEGRKAEQLQTIDGFLPQFAEAPWTYQEGMLPGLFGSPVPMPNHIKDDSSSDPTGVDEASVARQVFVADGVLYISGLCVRQLVEVYDGAGRPVYSGECAESVQIRLPDRGLYVVKLGGVAAKVIC